MNLEFWSQSKHSHKIILILFKSIGTWTQINEFVFKWIASLFLLHIRPNSSQMRVFNEFKNNYYCLWIVCSLGSSERTIHKWKLNIDLIPLLIGLKNAHWYVQVQANLLLRPIHCLCWSKNETWFINEISNSILMIYYYQFKFLWTVNTKEPI